MQTVHKVDVVSPATHVLHGGGWVRGAGADVTEGWGSPPPRWGGEVTKGKYKVDVVSPVRQRATMAVWTGVDVEIQFSGGRGWCTPDWLLSLLASLL